MSASDTIRLDKWLWFARFAKSRSLAAGLIKEGLVSLDGRAVKPHYAVRAGDKLTLTRGSVEYRIEIVALGARRGPAAEARALYRAETSAHAALESWKPLLAGDA